MSVHEATTPLPGTTPQTGPILSNFRSDLGVGAVFNAGLKFHAGRIALLPEVRYTRWGDTNSLTRKNEVGFLMGVNF